MTTDDRAILGRVPPHAEDAEKALLGGVLIDDAAFPLVRGIVNADAFYVEAHRSIFGAIEALKNRGVTVDAVSLAAELSDRDQLARCGGPSYLDQLIDTVPVAAHPEEHAYIIRDKASIRRLILACSRITTGAFEGAPLDELHRLAAEAAIDAGPAELAAARGDGLQACIDRDPSEVMFFKVCGENATTQDLGGTLGGFFPGQKLTIAGYTNAGKTGLSLGFAVSKSDEGVPVGYWPLEDAHADVEARTAGIIAGMSPKYILDARWNDERLYDAKRVLSWFRQRGFYTFPMIGSTPAEICASVQSAVVKYDLRLVVIDYLQAALFGGGRQTRDQQITDFIKQLTRAAGKRAVLILVSQVGRDGVKEGNRPQLWHLRDSGAIEFLSKAVVLMWKDGEEVECEDKLTGRKCWHQPLKLDVAKNKGNMGIMDATLHKPQSFVWPGTVRPSFRWEADEVTAPKGDGSQLPMHMDEPPPEDESAF